MSRRSRPICLVNQRSFKVSAAIFLENELFPADISLNALGKARFRQPSESSSRGEKLSGFPLAEKSGARVKGVARLFVIEGRPNEMEEKLSPPPPPPFIAQHRRLDFVFVYVSLSSPLFLSSIFCVPLSTYIFLVHFVFSVLLSSPFRSDGAPESRGTFYRVESRERNKKKKKKRKVPTRESVKLRELILQAELFELKDAVKSKKKFPKNFTFFYFSFHRTRSGQRGGMSEMSSIAKIDKEKSKKNHKLHFFLVCYIDTEMENAAECQKCLQSWQLLRRKHW